MKFAGAALVAGLAVLVWCYVAARLAGFVAHVVAYRRHMRHYPATSRRAAWRHYR